MRSNAAPLFVRVAKVFGELPRSPRRMGHKDVNTRRPSTKNVLFFLDLEPRFYWVLEGA
jgi:hypothetical protein